MTRAEYDKLIPIVLKRIAATVRERNQMPIAVVGLATELGEDFADVIFCSEHTPAEVASLLEQAAAAIRERLGAQ